MQTQRYGSRPYGVGLLVAGYDKTGPHLFETHPSGNYFDFKAQAIGARSQVLSGCVVALLLWGLGYRFDLLSLLQRCMFIVVVDWVRLHKLKTPLISMWEMG